MKKLLLLLLLVHGIGTPAWGQMDSYFFERLTTEQGLSHDMVQCIWQDHYGFLWFGTKDGLNRYDGYHFKVYQHQLGDTTSLSDNDVSALFEDDAGRLWVGTHAGNLNRYDPVLDKFQRYPLPFENQREMSRNAIRAIYQDQEGWIWIGSKEGGLCRLDPTNGSSVLYSQLGENLVDIYQDAAQRLWVVNFLGDLYEYQPASNSFVAYPNPARNPELVTSEYTSFLYELPSGEMLVGNATGIHRFDRQEKRFYPYDGPWGQQAGFRNNEIRCILATQSGEQPAQLWVGTWGHGIYHRREKQAEWMREQKVPGNPTSLSNNDVNDLYQDRSGVIWIATQSGLDKLDPARNIFQHYQHDESTPGSLNLNFVTGFAESPQGLWVATFGAGVSHMDLKTGDFQPLIPPAGIPAHGNQAVRAVRVDEQGRVWIGGIGGLDCYNPHLDSWTSYRHDPNDLHTLAGDDIMALQIDPQGRVWLGTYGKGVDCLDPRTGRVQHYQRGSEGEQTLSSDYIRSLFVDREENIWIGTLGGGLNLLDPQTGRITCYRHDPQDPHSLGHDHVNSIHQDQAGRMWVGTYEGISLLNPDSQTFTRYTEKEGLCHDRISEILSDEAGLIWISTFKGLDRFDPQAEVPQFIHYTLSHNIQGNVFNVNAGLKLRSGELLFGGANGFNRFTPASIHVYDYQPPIYLTSFSVNNQPVAPGQQVEGRTILPQSLTEIQRIELRDSDKILTFEFSGLSYSLPNKNQYAYKLEGIDEDWVVVGADRRFVTYTNLKQGEYVFRVKGAGYDGVWNETGFTLNLSVAPPWWQTWWAYLGYALCIALLMYAFQKYTIIKTNLKNELILEHLEQEKRDEVHRHKLHFFTNISHEFRTPLTLILGPIQQLLAEQELPASVRLQLELMQRNASRLQHLINQLMAFRKAESEHEELNASPLNLTDFLRGIYQVFLPISEERGIDYSFETPLGASVARVDQVKLETVFYNLLSNAFKHTPEGGRITLKLALSADRQWYEIDVCDTGKGIPAEEVRHIFDRYYSHDGGIQQLQESTGIGLALVKTLVDLHGGDIDVYAPVSGGTQFQIRLPYQKTKEKAEVSLHPPTTLPEWVVTYLATDADSSSQEQEGEAKESLHILVVEDNSDLRCFLKEMLNAEFRVSTVTHGQEALEFLERHTVDLVLTDVMMPEMDGWELCETLKADIRYSHLPVMMLTARSEQESQLQGLQRGADDYMMKPFSGEVLRLKIRNLLATREQLRERFRKELLTNPSELTVTSSDEAFLQRALQVVETHMDDSELNAARFCELLDMSNMQVYRKLKSLTGQSANEFIRTIRLKRAAQLLRDSSANISEIAYDVGFNDPKYFTKCFSKQFERTPTQFRQELEDLHPTS